MSTLVWAWSDDGFNFVSDDAPAFDPEPDSPYQGGFEDPRLVKAGDEYVLTFTGVSDFNRTPGLIAFSRDLKHWEWGGEVLPGRAIAIVNEKIDGWYYGYWGNSSVFLARSRDLRSWELLKEPALRPRSGYFDELLCESAAPPLLTDDGILLFYNGDRGRFPARRFARGVMPCYVHDILWTCYSTGWALFDRNDPARLIARSAEPVLVPDCLYEIFGISFYTVFAQGYVEFKGRRFLYYGCADCASEWPPQHCHDRNRAGAVHTIMAGMALAAQTARRAAPERLEYSGKVVIVPEAALPGDFRKGQFRMAAQQLFCRVDAPGGDETTERGIAFPAQEMGQRRFTAGQITGGPAQRDGIGEIAFYILLQLKQSDMRSGADQSVGDDVFDQHAEHVNQIVEFRRIQQRKPGIGPALSRSQFEFRRFGPHPELAEHNEAGRNFRHLDRSDDFTQSGVTGVKPDPAVSGAFMLFEPVGLTAGLKSEALVLHQPAVFGAGGIASPLNCPAFSVEKHRLQAHQAGKCIEQLPDVGL